MGNVFFFFCRLIDMCLQGVFVPRAICTLREILKVIYYRRLFDHNCHASRSAMRPAICRSSDPILMLSRRDTPRCHCGSAMDNPTPLYTPTEPHPLTLPTPSSFPLFPYDPPYPIQTALMRAVYAAVEHASVRVAVVESPTGTVGANVIGIIPC